MLWQKLWLTPSRDDLLITEKHLLRMEGLPLEQKVLCRSVFGSAHIRMIASQLGIPNQNVSTTPDVGPNRMNKEKRANKSCGFVRSFVPLKEAVRGRY